MAVPRLPLPGNRTGNGDSVSLPHPLDAEAAQRVRRIFALQRAGDLATAVAETARLHDDTLLGDILADRYLAHGARPEPGQLRLWLKTFSDLPDAPAIYQLLASVAPHVARPGASPSVATLGTETAAARAPEEADPADQAFRRNVQLDRTVRERAASGARGAASALRLIAATRFIDPLYAAQLRTEVALALFTAGDTARAARIAHAAFDQSGGRLGLAAYVAGLSVWRDGRPDAALPLFENASRAPLTAASIRSGAAFWAASAHLRIGDVASYAPWLERAAAAPRTFYGLIASRRLGRSAAPLDLVSLKGDGTPPDADDEPAPGRATLSEIDVEAVAATSAGRRAFALLQIGEPARAEATLRRLWPAVQNDVALCRSIQLVAEAGGLTSLSSQLAAILQARDGTPRDTARFPVPKLSPRRGFTVDPALVYALTRLESNFDASAVSGAGAHGLMQIMPVTAGFVLGHPDRFAGNAAALHNAGLNLEIGQRYLTYLSQQNGIDGDLIRLLASYNAGPSAVGRWSATIDCDDDPLMFIESLPSDETRDYVHRAFTYLWIYAARLGAPTPSLDQLAAGHWPRFADERLDDGRMGDGRMNATIN